ncbi:MAG: ferritin family protein [Phycisphaerae bacterium]|nr:ferritin family protein [Phycisphaerae bacterium]
MNQTLEQTQSQTEAQTHAGACGDVQFNVFEVLRIADELQHKAAKFFLRAAERFGDHQKRNICYSLAAWRARHQQAWARIRRDYSERTGQFGTFDPDNYLLSNPQVMASLACFSVRPGSRNALSGRETAEQIVRDAIRRARETAIFYQGLKGFVRDAESRTMIETMVAEEQRHIRLLSRSLERSQTAQRPTRPCDLACVAGAMN